MAVIPFDREPPGRQPDHSGSGEYLRYHVYSYHGATPDGIAYTRSFIVLKDGDGIIRRFTHLQDYACIYEKENYLPISANPEAKLYYICAMLNYILIDHGKENGIRHVFGITAGMMETFFAEYTLQPKEDGSHKGKDTAERCIGACTGFMGKLSKSYGGFMKVKWEDLYQEQYYYTKQGRRQRRWVPVFRVRGIAETSAPFRDLPTAVLELLVPLAIRHARDIAFAICLQAFAGLRAGEAMNVRQESSPLGPGLVFTEISGRVESVKIDLRRDYVLRSDGLPTGRIKKKRMQQVYPPFIPAFCEAYGYHKAFLAARTFEDAYAPMFVNERGMAMTYENYRRKFESLVNTYLRPLLLGSAEPKLRIYGQLLCENQLTPHSPRHWFSCELALRGEDIAGLQFWRGDRNPQSAFTYLQNKGDLIDRLAHTGDQLAQMVMKIGEAIRDEENGQTGIL